MKKIYQFSNANNIKATTVKTLYVINDFSDYIEANQ